MSRVRASSPAPKRKPAHVAQSVERFLGKEEVHRFDSGRGLQVSKESVSVEGGDFLRLFKMIKIERDN
jgi:hypothetical protein